MANLPVDPKGSVMTDEQRRNEERMFADIGALAESQKKNPKPAPPARRNKPQRAKGAEKPKKSLFDIKDDQAELSNLANESAHQGKLSEMSAIASKLWNAQEIRNAIIKDQNRRRLIDRSHRIGRRPAWDYQPITDASQQWVRAGKWTVEVEAEAHLDVR